MVAATFVCVILAGAAFVYYYYTSVGEPSPVAGGLQTPVDQSDLNWAGYAVSHNFSDPKPTVTGVSGSWIVPEVAFSQSDTFSAVWIGIGGYFGHTLIQTGTEQDCVGGMVQYSAWYELLPGDSITIDTLDISHGDEINASINLLNSVENLWSIEISDLSTGQSFNHNFVYGSSRLSAEWIVERPDVNNSLSQLADFGNVTLSNCKVVVDDEIGAFGYFPSVRIFMYDTSGTRLADVSNFSADGSSLSVQFFGNS